MGLAILSGTIGHTNNKVLRLGGITFRPHGCETHWAHGAMLFLSDYVSVLDCALLEINGNRRHNLQVNI
jgi:hypothetical protein